MNTSGIYKIQSIIKPERCYVGSALELKKRWRTHLWALKKGRHHSRAMQNHYSKYGESDLVFVILELCFPEFLTAREQHYLDLSTPYFNSCKVAGSLLGVKFSEETVKKMREKVISDETKQKLREASLRNGNKPPSHKGLHRSEEFKNSLKGNKHAAGQIHSEERNKKHSQFMKEYSAEHKSTLGKHWKLSEETKQNMKIAWINRKLKKSA